MKKGTHEKENKLKIHFFKIWNKKEIIKKNEMKRYYASEYEQYESVYRKSTLWKLRRKILANVLEYVTKGSYLIANSFLKYQIFLDESNL